MKLLIAIFALLILTSCANTVPKKKWAQIEPGMGFYEVKAIIGEKDFLSGCSPSVRKVYECYISDMEWPDNRQFLILNQDGSLRCKGVYNIFNDQVCWRN